MHVQGGYVVIVNTKIAQSQDLDILASGQWHNDIEDAKVPILHFKAFDKDGECYRFVVLI